MRVSRVSYLDHCEWIPNSDLMYTIQAEFVPNLKPPYRDYDSLQALRLVRCPILPTPMSPDYSLCSSFYSKQQQLVIKLRNNKFWSDGRPITIRQVAESLINELTIRKDLRKLLRLSIKSVNNKQNSIVLDSICPNLLTIALRDPCWAPGGFNSGVPTTGDFICIDPLNYKSISIPSYKINFRIFDSTENVIEAFNKKKLSLTSPADFSVKKKAHSHKHFKNVKSNIYAYALFNPLRLGDLSSFSFRYEMSRYISKFSDIYFLNFELKLPKATIYKKLKNIPKRITILYSNFWPNNILAIRTAHFLENFGIKAQLNGVSFNEFIKKTDLWDFDISIIITPGMFDDKWSLILIFALMGINGCGQTIISKLYNLLRKVPHDHLCYPSEKLISLVTEYIPVVPFGQIYSGILSRSCTKTLFPIEGGILPLELLN